MLTPLPPSPHSEARRIVIRGSLGPSQPSSMSFGPLLPLPLRAERTEMQVAANEGLKSAIPEQEEDLRGGVAVQSK